MIENLKITLKSSSFFCETDFEILAFFHNVCCLKTNCSIFNFHFVDFCPFCHFEHFFWFKNFFSFLVSKMKDLRIRRMESPKGKKTIFSNVIYFLYNFRATGDLMAKSTIFLNKRPKSGKS